MDTLRECVRCAKRRPQREPYGDWKTTGESSETWSTKDAGHSKWSSNDKDTLESNLQIKWKPFSEQKCNGSIDFYGNKVMKCCERIAHRQTDDQVNRIEKSK